MLKGKFGLLAAMACFGVIPGMAYSANSSEIRGVTIPASLCQPGEPESASKIGVDNVWTFLPNQTGYASLMCPLPVSRIRATTDAPYNFIEYYRVLYSDSDGANTKAHLQVEFRKQSSGWNTFIGPLFNSNSNSTAAMWMPIVGLNTPEVMSSTSFYWFRVTLYRETPVQQVQFGGISFE